MLVMNHRIVYGLKMENVYYLKDYREYQTDADIVLFYCCGNMPAAHRHGIRATTLLLSLDGSEASLLANMRKSLRQDIGRSLADPAFHPECLNDPTVDEVDRFVSEFNRFAGIKGIMPTDPGFLHELRQKHALALLFVLDGTGKALCGEADIITPARAYGAVAFSNFRDYPDQADKNHVARANKLLYWKSILNAKQLGCQLYDMGGLANGEQGADKDGIDNFKQAFGGCVATEYDFYHARTWKGCMVLPLLKWKKRNMAIWA